MDDSTMLAAAEAALHALRDAGFDQAQASASELAFSELNVADNLPSLLRSSDTRKLALVGIVDGRKAATELADFTAEALQRCVQGLFTDAMAAPADDANAVSTGQQARIVQGPQEPQLDALADGVTRLLELRAATAPRVTLREAECSHVLQRFHTLTSGGSALQGSVAWYRMMAFGIAHEGGRASSLNYAVGHTHDLADPGVPERFGIPELLRSLERQIETHPVGDRFTGDVVLHPQAVDDLLGWLLSQVGDLQLIAGSSLYREQVGQPIASPLLTVRSCFDMPGATAVSADGFATPPVTLVEQGVLRSLLPSLYASRKTGLPHVPVAAAGWDVAAGTTPLPELVGGVARGALVGRLSMGLPAANGNFSAVIKNSFRVEGGEVGHALAETMISGNVAQMLRDIVGASRETLVGTATRRPWLRVQGLHFS